jgi:hypothetical protein
MGHDNERSFATNEIDEQLKEGIDGESLQTLGEK